jgi:hypothetical protein
MENNLIKYTAEEKKLLKNYPPPENADAEFIKFWLLYLPGIVERDNYRPLHLQQLRILCQLLITEEKLFNILDAAGTLYETENKHGEKLFHTRPEVKQLYDCRKQIMEYQKMMGLLLTKGNQPTGTKAKGLESEWE